jgi:multiple sugar transport system permease protein
LFLNFRFFDVLGIFKATTGAPLNLIGTPIPQFLMAMTATGL